MSMHAVAYSQSQDAGGVLSYVTPVPDPSVRVQGNDIVVPQEVNSVIGEMSCVGATSTQAQLVSPSLRRTNPLDIEPLNLGIVPSATVPAVMHPDSPIVLDVNEALDARIVADPASAEQGSIVVFLADKAPTPVAGNIKHVRFSVTGAVTAGVWTNLAIAFIDVLPVGTYNLVGTFLKVAGGVAARWYPVGQKWRPGFPLAQALSDRQGDVFRNGKLGIWFSFDEIQPPTLDILASANAGSATYTGVMDLIPAS